MNQIANQIRNPLLRSDSTLHVIGVISNPARWHSRYRIARQWIDHMLATANVSLHLVEAAFGDRQHEVTAEDDGHLQVRTNSEIWIKENLINLGARELLPRDWKYVAWVDADVFFRNPGWALETIHQLQHLPIVQPWQQCTDLGPLGNIFQVHQSFGYVHQTGAPKQKNPGDPYVYPHSGFAWACTRAFWEQVGGLMDFAILGSADHHMAWSLLGQVSDTVHGEMSESFKRRALEWQARAMPITHGNLVGFTPGRIEHEFHGPKAKRYYRERWQILVDNAFDPDKDLERDAQGLIRLVGKPALEDAVRRYNRARAEDSIEET